ncbi:MAG: histidinol-phosphatase HisJ family protein [Eubacterium sp.]|nr:histidinol-phosphatase HisJ family protein [Candidatus Colimonas fimequi]
MYFADTHMHSICSHDSETPRHAQAEAAVALGMDEICITDHYNLIDDYRNLHLHYDWTQPRYEQDLALKKWGDKVKISYGIEIANVSTCFESAEEAMQEEGLDYVICAVHSLSKERGGDSLFLTRYKTPEMCYDYIEDYFKNVLESVHWNKFDTLAHLPYPMRYMRDRDGQDVNLDNYQDRIYEILKLLVENGRCLELNTKGWSPKIINDYSAVFKRYKELGGEMVSVGSDAHIPSDVGAHVLQAYDLLKSLGFKYLTLFEKRQPKMLPFD